MFTFEKIRRGVLMLALLASAGLLHAGNLTGKVIGVLDGDTIDVLDSNKKTWRIRFSGIDAPEKAQAFGARSKQHLSDLLYGQQVDIQTYPLDKYGRTIGKVMVGGRDANLEQVKAGFAWHYKQYASSQSPGDQAFYAAAENNARILRQGLWADSAPMPPWQWRHAGDAQFTAQSASAACACSTGIQCTGPRGGSYCIANNGKKRY